MNDVLENRLSSFQKVQGFLTLHTADTASIPAVATIKTELDNVVNKILTSAGISNLDITGYTVLKQNKRNDATKALLKIAPALNAFFSIGGKPQEAEKVDLTLSKINNLRDNDFFTYCMTVFNTATPNIASLAPFGALPADNAALNTKATDFLNVIQEPRTRIGERSAEFENLERLFDDAMIILNNKLDKVMPIFQVSNPTLYDAYLNARQIDDTGANELPQYQDDITADTILLVAEIPYLSSRTFTVANDGSGDLQFCLSQKTDEMQAKIYTIAKGEKSQRVSFNLQADANFLLIKNVDTTQTGKYRVWIAE